MTKTMTAQERKAHPIFTGVLKYFPDALMEVAHLSKVGNDQHNPGEPLHWAKEKSTDEGDALVRHQLDAGTRDTDGERHSAKVAWRALAQLQREIEAERAAAEAQYAEEEGQLLYDTPEPNRLGYPGLYPVPEPPTSEEIVEVYTSNGTGPVVRKKPTPAEIAYAYTVDGYSGDREPPKKRKARRWPFSMGDQ